MICLNKSVSGSLHVLKSLCLSFIGHVSIVITWSCKLSQMMRYIYIYIFLSLYSESSLLLKKAFMT